MANTDFRFLYTSNTNKKPSDGDEFGICAYDINNNRGMAFADNSNYVPAVNNTQRPDDPSIIAYNNKQIEYFVPPSITPITTSKFDMNTAHGFDIATGTVSWSPEDTWQYVNRNTGGIPMYYLLQSTHQSSEEGLSNRLSLGYHSSSTTNNTLYYNVYCTAHSCKNITFNCINSPKMVTVMDTGEDPGVVRWVNMDYINTKIVWAYGTYVNNEGGEVSPSGGEAPEGMTYIHFSPRGWGSNSISVTMHNVYARLPYKKIIELGGWAETVAGIYYKYSVKNCYFDMQYMTGDVSTFIRSLGTIKNSTFTLEGWCVKSYPDNETNPTKCIVDAYNIFSGTYESKEIVVTN